MRGIPRTSRVTQRPAGRSARLALAVLVLALVAARNPRLRSVVGESPPNLSVEQVRSMLDAALREPLPSDAARGAVEQAYGRALARLAEAEGWSDAAREHDDARTQAPARLRAIRVELAEPDPDVEPLVATRGALRDLESALAAAATDLAGEQQAQSELEHEYADRADRRTKLPELVNAARRRLEEATEAWRLAAASAPDDEVGAARVTETAADRQAAARELDALAAELETYDVRGEVLAARRDLSARFVARAEKRVASLQRQVDERRRTDVTAAEQEARELAARASALDPGLGPLAEQNASYAHERVELAQRLELVARAHDEARRRLDRVQRDLLDAQNRVEAVGLSEPVGLLLRERRVGVPSLRELDRTLEVRRAEIADVLYQRLEREVVRSALVDDFDGELDRALEQTAAGEAVPPAAPATLPETPAAPAATAPPAARAQIERTARGLLDARRELLRNLLDDYERTFTALVALDTTERALRSAVADFTGYVDERVLWIRSEAPLWKRGLGSVAEAGAWLVSPTHAAEVGRAIGRTLSRDALAILLVLLLAPLTATQRSMRIALAATGEAAQQPLLVTMAPTWRALALTVGIALPGPAVLWLLGRHLTQGALPGDVYASASGAGLVAAAWVYATGEFLRQVCRPHGLGEAHFRWQTHALRPLRARLVWMTAIAVPATWVVGTLAARAELVRNDVWNASLGRLTFVASMLALAVFLARLLHPVRGLTPAASGAPTSLTTAVRNVRYLAAAGTPLVLAGLAFAGYYYTAYALAARLEATLLLAYALVLTHAVAARGLLLARRAVGISQARERWRAARDAARGDGPEAEPSTGTVAAAAAEPALDLAAIDVQTRALLRSALAVAALVGSWLVWVDVLPALGGLRRVELWSREVVGEPVAPFAGLAGLASGVPGSSDAAAPRASDPAEPVRRRVPVTAADAMAAVLIALTTFYGARNLPALLEITVLRRLDVKAGERYAITTIVRYAITVVGLAGAFGAIGIGWSQVQWLAAAVTVGLGFGLQEIFANFVSGLILLFERPMRVGDIVTIGDVEGTVTRIETRATTITDWERRELIVPNREFITGRFMNWTLSDPVTRLVVPVGIAYGSDVARARTVLLAAAKATRNVLSEPAPTVMLHRFGDSSLDLRVRVFLTAREHWAEVTDELHTRIYAALAEAGIEIPFPQRDVHVRSIVAPPRPADPADAT